MTRAASEPSVCWQGLLSVTPDGAVHVTPPMPRGFEDRTALLAGQANVQVLRSLERQFGAVDALHVSGAWREERGRHVARAVPVAADAGGVTRGLPDGQPRTVSDCHAAAQDLLGRYAWRGPWLETPTLLDALLDHDVMDERCPLARLTGEDRHRRPLVRALMRADRTAAGGPVRHPDGAALIAFDTAPGVEVAVHSALRSATFPLPGAPSWPAGTAQVLIQVAYAARPDAQAAAVGTVLTPLDRTGRPLRGEGGVAVFTADAALRPALTVMAAQHQALLGHSDRPCTHLTVRMNTVRWDDPPLRLTPAAGP